MYKIVKCNGFSYHIGVMFFFVAISSSLSHASTYEDCWSCVGVQTNLGTAINNDSQESSSFINVEFYYPVTNSVDLTLGLFNFGEFKYDNMRRSGIELSAKKKLKISEKADLYINGGISSFGGNAVVGTGLIYDVHDKLSIDIGYGYYSSVTALSNDLYTFSVGLSFSFGDESKSTQIGTNPITQEMQTESDGASLVPKFKENGVVANIETSSKIAEYVVQEGDWIYQICRKFGISITDIRQMNPWVEERYRKGYEDLVYPGQKLIIRE